MNKFIGYGRMTADPDFRQTQSGTAVVRFTVAINRQFANKDTGEREADFISCVAFRNTAEFISRYFKKGSAIIVEGNLRNNNYTDKSGVKHYSMVVYADNVEFGESKSASQSQQNGVQQPQMQSTQSYGASPSVPYETAESTSQQHTYANNVQSNQQMSQLTDLGDFEEILSDGDTPF